LPFFCASNKFPQFKFDLAAGNDGAGLGHVFISSFSSYPTGFLTTKGGYRQGSQWLDSIGLGTIHDKDIWCVRMQERFQRY
jgi:hypothetical protein